MEAHTMCDTTAYVISSDGEETVMENVQLIRPEEGGIYLRNLFGEETVFEGRIKEVSLGNGRVILER
jgi:predicted RNA-binding protein